MNIGGIWTKTRLIHETKDDTIYLILRKGQIRGWNTFRNTWDFDFHPARLAPTRLSAKLESINEHPFGTKQGAIIRK
jgi:hypothetical protein